MPTPTATPTATQSQEIQRLEEEVLVAKERLAKALKARPPEVVRDYTLHAAGSGAGVRLSELFGASRDLLVVHNMGQRCPYCTLWADGFASLYKHLANRCAFVLTTPDEPAVAGAFASARGWTFPIISHAGTSFAQDLGYKGEEHTYGSYKPGVSGLRKRDDGTITRIATRPFGPGDDFCSLWPMLDLLEGGAGEWAPKFHY
jgi:predicted dithiol-disulfide oxidoreductase (DUF899 family)